MCRLLTPLGYPGRTGVARRYALHSMWLGAHLHTHKHTQMKTQKLDTLHLLGAVARPFGAEAGRRLTVAYANRVSTPRFMSSDILPHQKMSARGAGSVGSCRCYASAIRFDSMNSLVFV
ncbi:hypothetical protein EVAR_83544_1 [Eumeta japonica]|uniref:Uncharacterized protein n=1 Tax=Eumeta variegata TaxID=151549 RepID=A0A4C2A9M2_EUMVA|nr:hypothetical protein EVAR_83544_1 [Eumeta japonica]